MGQFGILLCGKAIPIIILVTSYYHRFLRYEATLANGYQVALQGWTNTATYAKGFVLNACQGFDVQRIPCPASATATVSGLFPGAVYHYEVFQYNEKLLGSPSSMYVENALAVNGEDFGHTVAFDSDAATAIGDATATAAGTIVFTFTRIDTEVHLSGLTIASTPEPTPSPTPAPSSSPTAAPTVAPTLAPTPTPTSLLCRARNDAASPATRIVLVVSR